MTKRRTALPAPMGIRLQPLELLIGRASPVSSQKSLYTDVPNVGTVPYSYYQNPAFDITCNLKHGKGAIKFLA